MTSRQALTWAYKKLQPKKIQTASLDAEVLLSFILDKPKEFIYTHPEKILRPLDLKKYQALIRRRAKGEPIAYLTNLKEFYGLMFYVDKRVLIPRPETELLIEAVLRQVNQNDKITIADIGTGSGCIAITLKRHRPRAAVYATDTAKKALTVAKKNATRHKAKVTFFQGDLFMPLKGKKIDILVANLPYGWKRWKNNTSAETKGLKFEPPQALFTTNGGLYLYEKLFRQIVKLVTPPPLIIGEFDPRQKKQLLKKIRSIFPDYQMTIQKDLAGLDRILIIKKKRCPPSPSGAC